MRVELVRENNNGRWVGFAQTLGRNYASVGGLESGTPSRQKRVYRIVSEIGEDQRNIGRMVPGIYVDPSESGITPDAVHNYPIMLFGDNMMAVSNGIQTLPIFMVCGMSVEIERIQAGMDWVGQKYPYEDDPPGSPDKNWTPRIGGFAFNNYFLLGGSYRFDDPTLHVGAWPVSPKKGKLECLTTYTGKPIPKGTRLPSPRWEPGKSNPVRTFSIGEAETAEEIAMHHFENNMDVDYRVSVAAAVYNKDKQQWEVFAHNVNGNESLSATIPFKL
jgi:hypothetical protein